MSKTGKVLGTKGIVAIASCVAVAAVGILAAVVFLGGSKEENYRTIAVEELNGQSVVTNRKETYDAYEGLHLLSGDDVQVKTGADMTLIMDMDKYMYAPENTHFWLESSGTDAQSKTVIHLEEGSVLSRIKNNLTEGSSYEVDTSNSTMAVRGTVFEVEVYIGEDGMAYTKIMVFDGKVDVALKTEDGTYTGVSGSVNAGQSALVRGNEQFSEFVINEDGEIISPIDYKEIPQNIAKELVSYIEDAEELSIGKELLMDYTSLVEHKTETVVIKATSCTEDGIEEIRCMVCNELMENVIIPATGHEGSDWTVDREATCEEAGHRQKVCSKCAVVLEEEEITPLGHVQGEYERVTDPDCTHKGEEVAKCTVCGVQMDVKSIKALGHTKSEWTVTKQATCTEKGMEIRVCSVCGVETDSREVAAPGHSMSGWNTTVAATCESAGSAYRTCSTCGYKETTALAKSAHVEGVWESETIPTCYDGTIEMTNCQVCGERLTREVPALGHDFVNAESFHSIDEANGTYTCIKYCANDCQASSEQTATMADICQFCGGYVQ